MPIGNSRISRSHSPSLRNWEATPAMVAERMQADAELEMGWGRLIFGHTFDDMDVLAERLRKEPQGTRNIAFYLRDPHVLLASSPQEFFLDPSHTFRLWAHQYRTAHRIPRGVTIRRLATLEDATEANRILAARSMVTWDPEHMVTTKAEPAKVVFLAESTDDGQLVGTVTGVDHVKAFDDPENGASLWCLAVDPQAKTPGVGLALVRHLVEHYFARGRQYVDLSVMHDNHQAIALYEKLGFRRVPVFAVKLKNAINEPLFTAPEPEERLNPYARIIVDEARRRGIGVDIVDPEVPLFRLELGGRAVTCHESLSELTSSIAFLRCDDKRLTRRVLATAGLAVPAQQEADGGAGDLAFLEAHRRIVVKPARGEQGRGVSVDVRSVADLEAAITEASEEADQVLLEEYVGGEDLRVIVIGNEMVAAAVRRPPRVVGNGRDDLRTLVEKYNRRREAATGGESRVPFDRETARVLEDASYDWDTILPEGEGFTVRRVANLHTGGTIHDVTEQVHPALAEASCAAARALAIPVVGLDLVVEDVGGPAYKIIEANERPGLANHEPQPTAERFLDLLFPETARAA